MSQNNPLSGLIINKSAKHMMSMSKPNGCEATLTSYAWQIKGANKPDKELVCNQERLRKYGNLGVRKTACFDRREGEL